MVNQIPDLQKQLGAVKRDKGEVNKAVEELKKSQ